MNITLADVRRRQKDPHLAADPTYSTLVMRRISPFLTWFVVRFTPLSADMVTLAAIASGVLAAALLFEPHPAAYFVAVVLLQFSYLCDTSDGEVARIRGTAGKRGSYLDLLGHHIQDRCLWLAASCQLVLLSGMAPAMGALVTGDAEAYAYLPASVRSFPDAEGLAAVMRAAGLQGVRYRLFGFGAMALHVGAAPA